MFLWEVPVPREVVIHGLRFVRCHTVADDRALQFYDPEDLVTFDFEATAIDASPRWLAIRVATLRAQITSTVEHAH